MRHLLCRWGLANDFASATLQLLKRPSRGQAAASCRECVVSHLLIVCLQIPPLPPQTAWRRGGAFDYEDQFKNETLTEQLNRMYFFYKRTRIKKAAKIAGSSGHPKAAGINTALALQAITQEPTRRPSFIPPLLLECPSALPLMNMLSFFPFFLLQNIFYETSKLNHHALLHHASRCAA